MRFPSVFALLFAALAACSPAAAPPVVVAPAQPPPTASCPAPPTPELRAWMDQSSVVARVTILRPHAKLPDALERDLDHLAVARLDAVLAENKRFVSGLVGSEVTLHVEHPVTSGEQLVFFGNTGSIGASVSLVEVGSYRDDGSNAEERIAVARRDRDRRDLGARIRGSRWVLTGRVVSVGQPQGRTPISEHDGFFTEAVIATEDALAGAPPPRVRVRFASSTDVAWWHAPKLTVGEEAVFFVQPSDDPAFAGDVLREDDVRPLAQRAAVADVLRCPA
ncbi:MAG TPA: hypothetical protein VIF62_25195 [Labilithrix sp.]